MFSTNKTEFQRFADERPLQVPAQKRFSEYRQIAARGGSFGLWLRNKHHDDFDRLYEQWWLKNRQLWGIVYAQQFVPGRQ